MNILIFKKVIQASMPLENLNVNDKLVLIKIILINIAISI